MTEGQAEQLIKGAVPAHGRWADLGAGTGTFTRALASLLGSGGSVLAIDRDDSTISALEALGHETRSNPSLASITVQLGDFTAALDLNELDGILLANALHFVAYPDQALVLRQLSWSLKPEGRIAIVEYDRDRGNDWVPYPISRNSINAVLLSAGLSAPVDTGRMRSTFGGELYSIWTSRLASTDSPPSHQP